MPKVSTIRADIRGIIEAEDVSAFNHGLSIMRLAEEPSGTIDDPDMAWPHLTYMLRTPSTRREEKTIPAAHVSTQLELLVSFLVRPGGFDNPVSREIDDAWDLAEQLTLALADDGDHNWAMAWSTIDVLDPPDKGRSGIIIRFVVHHPLGG